MYQDMRKKTFGSRCELSLCADPHRKLLVTKVVSSAFGLFWLLLSQWTQKRNLKKELEGQRRAVATTGLEPVLLGSCSHRALHSNSGVGLVSSSVLRSSPGNWGSVIITTEVYSKYRESDMETIHSNV